MGKALLSSPSMKGFGCSLASAQPQFHFAIKFSKLSFCLASFQPQYNSALLYLPNALAGAGHFQKYLLHLGVW